MRFSVSTLLALVLLAVPLTVSAGDLSGPRNAASLDSVLRSAPIHDNWEQARLASALRAETSALFTPISYRSGVALYRVESTDGAIVDYVLIRVPVDPTVVPEDSAEEAAPDPGGLRGLADGYCASGSPRCDVPTGTNDWVAGHAPRCTVTLYINANFVYPRYTDLDWNSFGSWYYAGFMNDEVSSIKTSCAGAYFFEHKNWTGSSYYLAANSSIANLGTVGLNDKISSMWIAIP